MTRLQKSRWESDGDNIRFSVPLAKVDKANRLVSGFATMDNVDSQGDIVTAEASAKAFAQARGNLREMHQPIAVGKIVSFRDDEFYNEDDGKFYRGVFVTARVSEGAQDTWTKVLDGTLTGFSIGGSINDASNEMAKDGSRQIRIVKDYDLVELSLVDNPANQLANIFSFTKAANGSVNVEGMLAETQFENVFVCNDDGAIKATVEESATCPSCGNEMSNIGWFESGNDRAEKVKEIVTKFRTPTEKGGVNMTDEITKSADAVTQEEVTTEAEVVVPEVVETEEVVETPEEETNEDDTEVVEEVVDEEETISKKIDELKDTVETILEKSRGEHAEAIDSLEKKIDEINEAFMTKASELETKVTQFGEKLETEKARLVTFEKKLDSINSSAAIKKSADLDETKPTEQVQKQATWDGAFSIHNLR